MSKQVIWLTQEEAVKAYLADHPELVPETTSVELRKTDGGLWMAIGHEPVRSPTMPWPPPPPPALVPSVGRAVHYVSYGTPGGEYASVCRAATIVEVGAWMQVGNPVATRGADADHPRERRTLLQEWEPDACALEVHNPTGIFFNTCHHNEQHAPGTWHWPERI